mmetsp:Transcript_89327/g.277795  ORF Transcript_89327/g.277795 Transcript_89327/m.277795 type:complete len:344 (-) Transcript_89327:1377-2408(-)
MGGQPCLHVVRVQDGIPRGVGDAPHAEHCAEHPGDARDAGLAPGRGGDGAKVAARGGADDGVVRQVRRQVRAHADGAEAGAAAAVRDAEGLMEVQVADVRADHAGGGEAELRVHIGPVHVHLTAVVVNDLADLLDVVLEEGAGGRVGHHEGREGVLAVLAHLPELGQVHALGVVNPLDLHVAHGRGGRVRAVRGPGDDADVAVALALRLEVLADDQQTGVLPRGAAGGLQRARVEAGAADEVLLQRLQHLHVALRLARGREGVHLADLRPAAGRQRGHGVELHGAGAERDHGLVQGQVLELERVHVAHHLGLGVDAVEDALLQEGGGARELGRHRPVHGDGRR